VADRPPCPALADALAGRSNALRELRRIPEAAGDARRALAVAREIGYPVGELLALVGLSGAANFAGDHDDAVRLARARDAGDLWNQGALLPRIVDLDLRAGRVEDAAAHLREGLQIGARTGTWADLLNGLYHCGTLCAATGRLTEALTVWAAHASLAGHEGFTDPPWFDPRWDKRLHEARQALGPDGAQTAEERGAAMSLATAAEYALMLTASGPPTAVPGLAKLSARERALVTLVAQGRTDSQIAAQLHISVRTVSSHLDRIRNKTGRRRRADMTRLALTAGLV
jgi:DNA-binding CsgD family transcriptional regulator